MAFLIQDPAALTYPLLRRQFVTLGGTLDERTARWDFPDEASFDRATLILDTWLDQTVVHDRNAHFVRDQLAALGGTQRQLADGSYAYEFPNVQAAANGLAALFDGRQLTAAHTASQEIIEHIHANAAEIGLPAAAAVPLDFSDRYGAVRTIAEMRPILYEIGISPSHQVNTDRLRQATITMPADRAEELLGFNPVLEPDHVDQLLASPTQTALAIRNITQHDHAHEWGVTAAQLDAELRRTEDSLAHNAQTPATRASEHAAYERTVSSDARTLDHDIIHREIGGYVDQERTRRDAIQNDQLDKASVEATLLEVLDIDGLPHQQPAIIEPGDWIQGRIAAWNRTPDDDRDINAEYVGVIIEKHEHPNLNSFGAAPEGSGLRRNGDSIAISRPAQGTITYALTEAQGVYRIQATTNGKTHVSPGSYESIEEGRAALADIEARARVSAGLSAPVLPSTHAVIGVHDFADPAFRENFALRGGMAKTGQPITLVIGADGQITHMEGHYSRPQTIIQDMPGHVVARPPQEAPELQADYHNVLACAKAQTSAWVSRLARKERERAQKEGREPRDWATREQNPLDVKERTVQNAEAILARQKGDVVPDVGMECEVLNVGTYYFAVRSGFNVAIHERAAFPQGRVFAPGERFGVVYEDGIPREYDLDQPVQLSRAPEYALEHVEQARELSDPAAMLEAGLDRAANRGLAARVVDLLWNSDPLLAQWADEREEVHRDLTFRQSPNLYFAKNGEQLVGDVLSVERGLGLAVLAVRVDDAARYVAVPLRGLGDDHVRTQLGQWDHLAVQYHDAGIAVQAYIPRAERIAHFTRAVQHAIGKEYAVAPESIIARTPNFEPPDALHSTSDVFHGVVVARDPELQYVAVAAGGKSVTCYDLQQTEQPLALGDEVTIATYEGRHRVTDRITQRDRGLAPEADIQGAIQPRLARVIG